MCILTTFWRYKKKISHLFHNIHVIHMTTHSTPPVSVGPLSLPYARVYTRSRPTYVASATSPPRSLRFSLSRRRDYFFPRKFTMPSAGSADFPVDGDELKFPLELADESDFDRIVSSDGLITICGFGSLLSGQSSTIYHFFDFGEYNRIEIYTLFLLCTF